MKLFRRRDSEPTGEHLPAFIPTTCIGEACPNYTGKDCDDSEMEWMTAGGPVEKGTRPNHPYAMKLPT